MKHLSLEASIETVRKLFANSAGDTVTLEEAFSSWGRDQQEPDKNRSWLNNKLTHLRFHKLVKPVYLLKNNKRILGKIQLTADGLVALGRVDARLSHENLASLNNAGSKNEMSIQDIMRVIPKLQQENPEFEIIFSVSPKKDI